MSLRWRLLVLHAVALGLLLATFGVVLHRLLQRTLVEEVDERGLAYVQRLQGHLSAAAGEVRLAMSRSDVEPGILWRVTLPDGRLVASSGESGLEELFAAPAMVEAAPSCADRSQADQLLRVIEQRLPVPQQPDRVEAWVDDRGEHRRFELDATGSTTATEVVIQVAEPLRHVQHSVRVVAWLLLIGLPVILILSLAAGWSLVGRALRPVARIVHSAEAIDAAGLQQRVPQPTGGDEIARLARVINAMLARLEAAFRRERAFTQGASHELRTPLATLRSMVTVGLRRRRSITEHEETLRDIACQVDRLQRLIDGLLFLSRPDGDLPMDEVDVIDLVEAVTERLAERHPDEPPFELRLPAQRPTIVGNLDLLDSLVANCCDNALRYGRAPRWIAITDVPSAGSLDIVIGDHGAGVAAPELERLFEPFYRGGRQADAVGAGLGLAISRRIVKQHGGSIRMHSDGSGTRILLRLPRQPALIDGTETQA